MPDWDDPDLEASPYGWSTAHPGGLHHRAGERDLEAMRHRRRNLLENYADLVTGGGVTHHGLLARFGITEREWANCVMYATQHGLPVPTLQHPNPGMEN